jgi:hypothetical protein
MSYTKFKLNVSKKLKPIQREALAKEVIDFIINRSRKGFDKNNKPLPGYSDSYIKSLDFKIAGKSKGDVNLTLSREMLESLSLLSHRSGEIHIGYEAGTPLAAKVEGNVRGTYGQSKPIRGKKRDFLGITQADLRPLKEKVADLDDATAILEEQSEARSASDATKSEDAD